MRTDGPVIIVLGPQRDQSLFQQSYVLSDILSYIFEGLVIVWMPQRDQSLLQQPDVRSDILNYISEGLFIIVRRPQRDQSLLCLIFISGLLL